MVTVVNTTTKKAASLEVNDSGELLVSGAGGGGGGGGDASAANQTTEIARLTSILAATDGLEGLIGTTNSTLTTIDGHVDGIEALLGTSNTNTSGTKTSVDAVAAKLPVIGKKATSASLASSAKSGGDEYEAVAVSQTNQTIGATGAVGDYLEGILVIVATAATAQVSIKDGSNTAIVVFPNSPGAGVGSYYIPLGITSVQGAWQVTTGAGATVLAMGDFT